MKGMRIVTGFWTARTWVGAGMEQRVSSKTAKVLPAGEVRPGSAQPQGGLVATGHLLD